jgi:hypothetical protein
MLKSFIISVPENLSAYPFCLSPGLFLRIGPSAELLQR